MPSQHVGMVGRLQRDGIAFLSVASTGPDTGRKVFPVFPVLGHKTSMGPLQLGSVSSSIHRITEW